MPLLTGPVLFFRGVAAGRWRLAAVVVAPAGWIPPLLTVEDGAEAVPEALGGRQSRTVWRYTFSIPMDHGGGGVGYRIGERSWRVFPPAAGLRVAYTACNGTEDERPGALGRQRNALWRQLAAEHARAPFHLLIQGGDQLYADTLWETVPGLSDWWKLPWGSRLTAAIAPDAADALRDFYFERYCWLWSQDDIAPLLASIPSLMMWDDHDIFDGWGSHPPNLQSSPVFQTIWQAAREQFAWFQLGVDPRKPLPAGFGDASGGHFGWAYEVDGVGIIAPDIRSQRTRGQVMGESGWRWFTTAMEELGHCRRVLLVSTVPVVNIDLSPVERVLRWMPGHFFYKDDLRDQWRSYGHRREWRRLTHFLLDFSRRYQTPVAILSGEIHLGALGRVTKGNAALYQLTASGIVHPPPPPAVVRLVEWFSPRNAAVDGGARLSMLPLPGHKRRYLAARNWLDLACGPQGPLEARWHAEGAAEDITLTLE